ncbi:unnamed protein product [Caretta caretta]
MASTSRPNEALWREISQGLAAACYSRNVAQCRSKWKALKQAFYSECHSPRVPPHYRTMKKIWKAAGRPVFGDRCLPGKGPRDPVLPVDPCCWALVRGARTGGPGAQGSPTFYQP